MNDLLYALESFFFTYLLITNLLAFLAFGLDKFKAVRGSWRIPEKTLFLLAGIGGSLGSFLGMHVFHHKTRKTAFRFGIPAIFVLQMALVMLLSH